MKQAADAREGEGEGGSGQVKPGERGSERGGSLCDPVQSQQGAAPCERRRKNEGGGAGGGLRDFCQPHDIAAASKKGSK